MTLSVFTVDTYSTQYAKLYINMVVTATWWDGY